MKRITKEEALYLLDNTPLLELGERADSLRESLHREQVVTFVVDRNINYTNVCVNQCRFCAFYRSGDDHDAYVLDREELFRKIEEAVAQGGTQILIQGGLHPELDLSFYIDMLSAVKERYPINIHGFSPPEIIHIAKQSKRTVRDTLMLLRDAGLDSIPGGGAEILSDRVRKVLSPRKIRSSEWLMVMEEAHTIGMKTTATMMFGSIETPEDIVEHLDALRELQDRTGGFTAFIPWSFQPGNTEFEQGRDRTISSNGKEHPFNLSTGVDYLRTLSLSRIFLDNFRNIQASWVTQGIKMAQVSLRFGANDFGSTMIEENVVRAAGVHYSVSMDDILHAIRSAGFMPAQRDTYYRILRLFKEEKNDRRN